MLKGRKILITGLTGRLGGAVAKALAHDNELWGLARYSGAGQKEYWEAAGVRTIVGDYGRGDLAAVPDDCEYVVHIAANCEPNSHEEGMIDNAEGVGRLMYHCRKAKAFLHTSTVGVYAHKDDPEALYSEDDPVGGGSLGHYTGTKLAGEGAARAFPRYSTYPRSSAAWPFNMAIFNWQNCPQTSLAFPPFTCNTPGLNMGECRRCISRTFSQAGQSCCAKG